MRKLFNWANLAGTLLVFLFIAGIGSLGIQLDFLNAFEEVLDDYEITDIYYTKIRDNTQVAYDENIVLVNIGPAHLGRRSIAQQLEILQACKPKVIGIDVKFFAPKEDDPIGDFLLEQALSKVENLVLASEFAVLTDTSSAWDTLFMPTPKFAQYGHTAYVNVGNRETSDFTTWRDIPIREKTRTGKSEPCFAVKIAELYDPETAKLFLERGNEIENIYFKGNLDKFTKLDVEDVIERRFAPELIEGKIVMIGYLGNGYTNYYFDEDKFYTPLNEKSVGRGVPDMYGVVVHANIVSMILAKQYINELPNWVGYLIAFLVCFFNVALFARILENKKLAPYYGFTKIIQLIEILLFLTVIVFAFGWYNYKIDLTLTTLAILLAGDLTEIFVDILIKLWKPEVFRRFIPKLNITNTTIT